MRPGAIRPSRPASVTTRSRPFSSDRTTPATISPSEKKSTSAPGMTFIGSAQSISEGAEKLLHPVSQSLEIGRLDCDVAEGQVAEEGRIARPPARSRLGHEPEDAPRARSYFLERPGRGLEDVRPSVSQDNHDRVAADRAERARGERVERPAIIAR